MVQVTSIGRAPGDAGAKDEVSASWRIVAAAVAAAAAAAPMPAEAAGIFDTALTIIDDAILSFEEVVGTFLLLFGLVVAWVVGWKNTWAGVGIAMAVVGFAAMVGNYDTIATELGFGG